MNKIVYILVGVPGSGKSTLIHKMMDEHTTIVSADHYFMRDGKYRFDRQQLGKAHTSCQNNFELAIKLQTSTIFVDNTNIKARDRKFYIDMALENDYEVQILALPADVEASVARNVHGVPAEAIQRMKDTCDLEFGKVYKVTKEGTFITGEITKQEVGLNA